MVSALLKYAYNQLPGECASGSLADALHSLAEEPYLVHERSDEAEREV